MISPLLCAAMMMSAQIKQLNCSGLQFLTGLTTVTATGEFQGAPYLNIGSVPQFGFPNFQQAQVTGAEKIGGMVILKLKTMVTMQPMELILTKEGTRGFLKLQNGDKIPLECTSDIVI